MKKVELKVGQIWKSKTSKVTLKITGQHKQHRCWHTKKKSKGKSHKIHDGTISRFYELVEED